MENVHEQHTFFEAVTAVNSSTRLCASDISLAYGGQQVLKQLDLEISEGQIALLRGANGSGKTTLLNILSGFMKPDTGTVSIELNGSRINVLKTSADALSRNGIARLWQDTRLFPNMNVIGNVMAAFPKQLGINPLMALFAFPVVTKQETLNRNKAMEYLSLVGMADRKDSSCDMLSVGQAKRVAIARMLQTGAHVLLLDEPLAGLDKDAATSLVDDLKHIASKARKAMLIVEHDHSSILPICDLCFTLEDGKLRREKLRTI